MSIFSSNGQDFGEKNLKEDLSFKFFPRFAAYILENCLEDFVAEQLCISKEEKIPLLKYLAHLSEEELMESGVKSSREFFSFIANNQASTYIKKSLTEYLKGEIPFLERNQILAEDITIINFVRRKTIRKFLMEYTSDIELFSNIMEEVDRFVAEDEAASFKVYIDIQKETITGISKQVKDSEEYTKQIIENAPDSVIVIDEFGIISMWNPKTEELFGWKAAEVLGLNLSETIIPHQYREAHKAGMKRLMQTGEARILNKTLELTALNNQGREFHVALTISQSVQNDKKYFIAFIRDISKEKHTQEELNTKTKQLERMNESLEYKNFELERINRELESFNYIASHDLQEPLRKIQIFSNRIMEKELDDLPTSTKEYLEKIINASARMKVLIEDLLMFSQSTSKVDSYESIDLHRIFGEVTATLSALIDEKKILIQTSDLPVIRGVPFQIQQVFMNIISNAIKYSKDEISARIKISSSVKNAKDIINEKERMQYKNYFEIRVEDNGIGFDETYSEKIFELFQRLHNKEKYSGSGIGLAICKKIIQNHNGLIKATSKPGLGSVFFVYFPCEDIIDEKRVQLN